MRATLLHRHRHRPLRHESGRPPSPAPAPLLAPSAGARPGAAPYAAPYAAPGAAADAAPGALPPGARRVAAVRRVGHPDAQPEGAADVARPGARAGEQEGGVGVAGDLEEAERHGAWEHRGAVEHHEGEGAAAQEDVGAPGSARRVRWADHPEAGYPLGLRPVGGGEGAGGVDHGHPAASVPGRAYHAAEQRRHPVPGGAEQLGDPPAGEAAEHAVEPGDAGGEEAPRGDGVAGAVGCDVGDAPPEDVERGGAAAEERRGLVGRPAPRGRAGRATPPAVRRRPGRPPVAAVGDGVERWCGEGGHGRMRQG